MNKLKAFKLDYGWECGVVIFSTSAELAAKYLNETFKDFKTPFKPEELIEYPIIENTTIHFDGDGSSGYSFDIPLIKSIKKE